MTETVKVTITGATEAVAAFRRLSAAARGRLLAQAATAGALPILTAAQTKAPVRTGNLRRSLHTEVLDQSADQATVMVGTDVDYARPVEEGTSRRIAKPYLRPAFDTERENAIRETGDAFRDIIEAAVR